MKPRRCKEDGDWRRGGGLEEIERGGKEKKERNRATGGSRRAGRALSRSAPAALPVFPFVPRSLAIALSASLVQLPGFFFFVYENRAVDT